MGTGITSPSRTTVGKHYIFLGVDNEHCEPFFEEILAALLKRNSKETG